MRDAQRRTIDDFGDQWTRYTSNEGYYGSVDLLADLFGPLLNLSELRGAYVADIGSGTGRIVRMLLDAGAARVMAVEPSSALNICKRNTQDLTDRIEYIHDTGECLPKDGRFDYVVSIGVLHHIPDPAPVVKAAFDGLRPGGRMLAWLYGREGNEFYLRLAHRLRRVTTELPHSALSLLCHVLSILLSGYILACRRFDLPMRMYMVQYLSKLTLQQRYLTIYDQLNPQVADYYTAGQAYQLFTRAGFSNVKLYHRHGYSWTVIGTKHM